MSMKLMEKVLNQIKDDVEAGDMTAVAELLSPLPNKTLEAYLPEEE